jgi:hypothetical protein
MIAHNNFLQPDQIVLSCLLQKAQKPRQHALAAEERRYEFRRALVPTEMVCTMYA